MPRVLKLSKNMKPFISSVSKDGPVQTAFAEAIGRPVGACVSAATKGKIGQLSGAQIHAVVKKCSRDNGAKGKSLPGNFVHGKTQEAKIARARKRAGLT